MGFIVIQEILKVCAVPSVFALTLAYTVVKLVSSRQPEVHSSNCRVAMAIAIGFGVGILGHMFLTLLGLLFVLSAPKSFLWWPVESFSSETPAALLATPSPADVKARIVEEDEEMQVVRATAESLAAATGGSSFAQAVAVGDALAALRAARGVGAASAATETEAAVVTLGEPSPRPSSVPGFSLQADYANRDANLQLLETAHSHTASLKIDAAAAEWVPSCLIDADGVNFTPCQTQGAGAACAIHAVFGRPQRGAFSHATPRTFARSLLGPSLAVLRNKISAEIEMTLQRVTTSLWGEFLLPFVRSCPGREAICFARALKRLRPQLLNEMCALVRATIEEDRRYINAKMDVEAAARSLFCVEAEEHFIRPVAVSLGLLPNASTDFLQYTAAELQQQDALWENGRFEFLAEAS